VKEKYCLLAKKVRLIRQAKRKCDWAVTVRAQLIMAPSSGIVFSEKKKKQAGTSWAGARRRVYNHHLPPAMLPTLVTQSEGTYY
jgi:hypothetical protein